MIRLTLAALILSAPLAHARQATDPWPTGSRPAASQPSAPGDAGLSPAAVAAITAKMNASMAAIARGYTGRTPTFGAAK